MDPREDTDDPPAAPTETMDPQESPPPLPTLKADSTDPQEDTEAPTEESKSKDEFAYLQREFTTELFKLEISNLGIFGIGDFKKMLKSLNIDAAKVKTPHRRDCAFICLRSKEALDEAIKILTGYVWKGKTLSVKVSLSQLISNSLFWLLIEHPFPCNKVGCFVSRWSIIISSSLFVTSVTNHYLKKFHFKSLAET